MYRLFRRKNQPPRGSGKPARWTTWEIGLIILSLLMIAFPLYVEVYQWLYPTLAPAAPLPVQPRETVTDTPSTPGTIPSPTTGPSPTRTRTPTTGPSPTFTN